MLDLSAACLWDLVAEKAPDKDVFWALKHPLKKLLTCSLRKVVSKKHVQKNSGSGGAGVSWYCCSVNAVNQFGTVQSGFGTDNSRAIDQDGGRSWVPTGNFTVIWHSKVVLCGEGIV